MKVYVQIATTGAALAALLWLGWTLARPMPAPATATAAVLWTSGDVAEGRRAADGVPEFALATAEAPAGVPRIPDVAGLRRRLPQLRRLEVKGDGLAEADLAATRGLEVRWQRPESPPARPVLRGLGAPRTLARGDRLAVHGVAAGLPPGGSTAVALTSPDGAVATATVTAGADGTAAFAVQSAAAAATGRFEWTLRVGADGEAATIGVAVVERERPRVLLLQASPAPEFARLQQWLADEGAPVAARIRVSAERFRFVAANGAPAEFAALDAAVFAAFDAVVSTEAAVAELPPAEAAALAGAVAQGGLGLLVVGEAAAARAESGLLPWAVPALPADAGMRLARLRLAPGLALGDAVAVGESELPELPTARTVVADPQGRILAAVRPRGAGRLGRSVMADTWRWVLAGQGETHAQVWRELLAAVARPAAVARGSWDLADAAPVFAGEAVRLRWRGPAAEIPRAVNVETGADSDGVKVGVTASADGREAAAVFRPERAGWHRIGATAADGGCDLYVYPAEALAEFRAERRREAMAARAGEAAGAAAGGPEDARGNGPWLPAALFLLAAGWLWFRERKG